MPRIDFPDALDEQIAQLLGQNAEQNSETLAEQLNVSSATVRRRLKKLIQSGALRIVGQIDPTKFGLVLAVLIALSITHDKVKSVAETLAKRSEIWWISTTTGRFDAIAMARFPSTLALSKFLTEELPKIEGVTNSETSVCLDIVKGRFVLYKH